MASKDPDVDLRLADVWAIGVTLFVCLTGRMPFVGDSLIKTLELLRRGVVEIPPEVEDPTTRQFLQSLLEADPRARVTPADALKSPWFDGGNEVCLTTNENPLSYPYPPPSLSTSRFTNMKTLLSFASDAVRG